MRPTLLSCHAYAGLTVLLWASAYVGTKVALTHFGSPELGLLRCGAASITLAIALSLKRPPLPRRRDAPWLALCGLTGFALYLFLFNKGSESLNPTTSCVLIATSPVITACFAGIFFRERITAPGWAAIALGFSGVLVMALWQGSLAISHGLIWMLAAASAISMHSILLRKLSGSYDALSITAWRFFAATLALAFLGPETASQAIGAPPAILSLACYLGVFPSALAYLAWAKALSLAPKTSTVTNYMFLTPFLALLLEFLVLDQTPDAGTFLGGGMILCSLLLFGKAGKQPKRHAGKADLN